MLIVVPPQPPRKSKTNKKAGRPVPGTINSIGFHKLTFYTTLQLPLQYLLDSPIATANILTSSELIQADEVILKTRHILLPHQLSHEFVSAVVGSGVSKVFLPHRSRHSD
jgi:hypothetical protein